MGRAASVATCAENSFEVNRNLEAVSYVTTASGHRGVGAVTKSKPRPPRSSESPVRTVRNRARKPFSPFQAPVSASFEAGVPGLSAW